MVSAMKKKGVGVGEFIIREDDEGDEIFVLEKGRIEVSYYDDDGSRKKLKELHAPGRYCRVDDSLPGEKCIMKKNEN